MSNKTTQKRVEDPPAPSVRMGEIDVVHAGVIRTLLGSCIGVAIYDKKLQLGGLAHVVLPESRGRTSMPGKYADTAIPSLIGQIRSIVNGPLDLEAKIAGGANMFETKSLETIGKQNIEAIEKIIREQKIQIRGRHCGGNQGRRMELDTSTGKVTVDIVGQDTIEI